MNILGIEISQEALEIVGALMTTTLLILICWETSGKGRLKYARRGIIE